MNELHQTVPVKAPIDGAEQLLRSKFGSAPDKRFWQAIGRQIDHSGLPRGEFAGATFVSGHAKARAGRKVALIGGANLGRESVPSTVL
ncbi:hypothetical protein [Collimonas silvisoli]|uniref:hypothetical protein n=1 Tax=Collimonas silvisoli TaxID=2825884 RepID=UPI001B8CEF22|nr:hypothetical protein [Collimonas silvisoli]